LKICVDTVVLIDILKDEFRSNQLKFYAALSAKETLLAPVVVFAELMPQFRGDSEMVETFFLEHKISIETLDLSAVSIAASRWLKYLKRKSKAKCPKCGHHLSRKEHFLSDFYIGGFALDKCDAILTRDRGIYKKYFPDLKVYDPGKQ
jgi:predicted nucleic acid-binding protein